MDIAIVGAGPCGIAVGAAARKAGLEAKLFDKGCITSSLVDYPYYMSFFSTADRLEVGGIPFTIPGKQPTRQEALVYYRRVVEHFEMDVHQYEEVVSIEGSKGDFTLHTRSRGGEERTYGTKAVAIATGGFHEPNYLEVPGEDLPKVFHYYKEPYPFYDQDVLVVGGRNSAVESALEMFRAGARVTMVHFLDSIDDGVKPWVVPDITNRLDCGEIGVYWRHRVAEIKPRTVVLRNVDTDETVEVPNDWIFAMTGWRPTPMHLVALGVEIDPDSGVPSYDPDTMETNVPGVYVAGVLAAGNDANKIFIENGREHGPKIVASLRPDQAPENI